ncbi:T9SS type A sorting domain-containing protein [Lacinutrix sp. WUR7]|uniref:T9SS type A sorting domain-containing protein n=1 Tax=Lacinutrix sp. WUR7 TaxID=2653681 RepID=UPI00193C9BFC|nr:T9SS type A sorting domain-containing protein [Lacinutrix sp. WUR7]QRM90715.1 T9SS type A sorting domain-containing protein [Lacinutrix sp. WUR7]
MKKQVLLFLFTFCLTFCATAQIGFQENVIIDQSLLIDGVESVYTTDIDGDGDLDVLLASFNDNKITWYENIDGLGNYGNQQIINSAANGAKYVYAADIDGDGDMDVLSASSDNKIAWYENTDGLGNFGNEQIITIVAYGAKTVHAFDIDGDGDMDVLASSSGDGKIGWYENTDGQGTFGNQQVITLNASDVKSVYPVDLDNDGDMDLIAASVLSSSSSRISWYENTNGLGDFDPHLLTFSVIGVESVYAADIDNDGDMDVLSASSSDNKLAWYDNTDGQGTFGTQQIISTIANDPKSVYASDIDNDGDMDVISASDDDKISWYENTDGLGSFSTSNEIGLTNGTAEFVITSDIDNDGDMDVLAASYGSNALTIFKNLNGLGNFSNPQSVTSSAAGAKTVYSTDVDGDGDLDVLSASLDGNISWYENQDGQGSFSSKKIISYNTAQAWAVHAADIDGDGDMDVLSIHNGGNFGWFENLDGMGNFGEKHPIRSTNQGKSVYGADLDNDGDVDVLTADRDGISWHENIDGLGNFGSEKVLLFGSNITSTSVYASDLNGDGNLDVLQATQSQNKISWYENDGNSYDNFGGEDIISSYATYVQSVFASDLDGDGDMDVLSANQTSNSIVWYENIDGFGNFGLGQTITNLAYNAKSVYASDIDGDGDMDVLSASSNDGEIAWYENINGLGSFGSQQIIAVNAGAESVFAADIDQDGNMDVLFGSSSKIAWYKNLGTQFNEINGTIRMDMDANGCDVSDNVVPDLMVVTESTSDSFATFTSSSNGLYQLFPNEGEYTTSITSQLPYYYVSNPTSQISNFTGVGNTDTIDFCIEPIGAINDLNISVYPSINEPRPGFNTSYQIVYKNVGTTQLSGNVTFEFENTKLSFLNASETISTQTTNTLTFNFTDLIPFETRIINLEFNVFAPPTTNIDDALIAIATITPVAGDETEDDNVFTLNQTVIGSYDPNDISVLEGEEILLEDADKYLHYIIRFQNTGTASAINVHVENVLDDKLDYTTMQIESLSHTGKVEITNGTMVDFIFDNINLADSTNDEPNSHGFIAYKIKPKRGVAVGDIFYNTADIFFDFNPAITTNTVATEIVENLSVGEFNTNTFSVYPNPTESLLTIKSKVALNSLTIYDVNGRKLNAIELSNNALQYELDVTTLSNGIYFLEVHSSNAKQTQKFIKN